MDFTVPSHVQDIARRVQQFVEDVVLPIEKEVLYGREITKEDVFALRRQARAAGLFAPTMPKELGGMGLAIPDWIPVLEAAGRSMLGPMSIHCSAPDEGNMHTLHMFANDDQREQYLKPLAAGEIFSGFSMTEPPPGAGS